MKTLAVLTLSIMLVTGCMSYAPTVNKQELRCAKVWTTYKLEADAITACLDAPRCTLTVTDLKRFDLTHAQVLADCNFDAPGNPDLSTPIEPVLEWNSDQKG